MYCNTAKGFAPTLPSKAEINMVRNRFKSVIRQWRLQKIKVVFAYVNALTYRACCVMGVLECVRRAQINKKGFHRIVGDIKAIALKGISRFNITIEGMVNQIAKLWDISVSEASLRKYRYELRDLFGLFHFESQPFRAGCRGDRNARRPPALTDFSLPLACILLEALEDILINERGCSIEDFPGNAAMCRFIYDALFRSVTSYRRKQVVEDAVVMSQGSYTLRVSEIDWNDCELTEKGEAAWLGLIKPIPDENGRVPDLC